MAKIAITSFVFSAQPNKVVPVNVSTAKVALGAQGTLLTAQTTDGTTRWTLLQAPSWVALSTSQDNKTATLSFNLANQQISQVEPFNFMIVASAGDGSSEDMRAVSLAVVEPLEVKEVASSATSINLLGYDDTILPVKFKAFTGDSPATNVRFIAPNLAALPGLRFLVDGDDAAYLEVVPRGEGDPSGGVKHGAGQETVTIKAYKAGSIYDSPENAAALTFTLNFTGEKAGTLVADIAAAYDISTDVNPQTGAGAVVIECPTTFVGGKAVPVTYEWRTSGTATGRFLTGGTSNTNRATWEATTDGTVGFSVDVKSGATVLKTLTLDPFKVSAKNPNAPAALNWSTSAAIPVILLPQDLQVRQPRRNKAYVRFELPDLLSGETATMAITVTPLGTAPAVTDARVSNGTISLPITDPITVAGNQSKVRYLFFTIPDTANAWDRWKVEIKATSNVNSREGLSVCLVTCTGLPLIHRVESSPTYSDVTRLSGSVGSQISAVPIRAYVAVQNDLPANPPSDFFLSEPNTTNSTLTEIQDVILFGDVLASDTTPYPLGVYPNVQNKLEGPLHLAGDFYLYLLAKKAGFASKRSQPIPMRVLPGVAPVVFTSFSSNYTVVTSSTVFPINWGYSGAGDLYIQKNNEPRKKINVGELSATFTGVDAHAVFTLSAVNSLGTSYAIPLLIRFSGSGVISKLPASPTIASITEANDLEVTWMPPALNSSYSAYKSWDITLFDANGQNAIPLVKADGTPITGFENADPKTPDIRRFKVGGIQAGGLRMSMQAFSTDPAAVQDSEPWDTTKLFPTLPPTAATINGLDSTTAQKGESVTISLGSGVVADKWRVVFSDQSTSDWLPMSSPSILKSFMVGGETQVITIEVEKDYSTSLPPVKLRRSVQKSLFIVDEDFIPVEGSDPVLGNLGIGGDAGFEVTDGTAASYEPQNFAVFTKAIVKDEITQELKLMIGVARGRDASSVLGTMALDVFPLPGRPHAKELVKPVAEYLVDDGGSTSAVRITTQGLPPVTMGQSLTWTKAGGPGSGEIKLQAEGGRKPYTWAADNLPAGVRFTADGTLSGTVLAPGTYPIDFSILDNSSPSYVDKKTLNLLARSDLAVTTQSIPDAHVGAYYEKQLEAEGGVKTYSWKLASGTLPHGLSIDTTGKISGYACTLNSTSDFTSDFTIVVQVQDSLGSKASKQYAMSLKPMDLFVGDPDQAVLFNGQRFLVRLPVCGGNYTVDPATGISSHTITVNHGGLFEDNPKVVNGFLELNYVPTFAATNNAPVRVTVADARSTVVKDCVFVVKPRLAPFTPFLEAGFAPFFGDAGQTVSISGLSGSYALKDDPISTLLSGLKADVIPSGAGGRVSVSGPATGYRNVETNMTTTLLKSGVVMGLVSRPYSLVSPSGNFTAATPSTLQTTTMPAVVGRHFFLDPTRPFFNAIAQRRQGLTAKIRQGHLPPMGLSFDARNGMFYGTVRGTDVTQTTVDFLDAQGNVVGTVETTFDLFNTDLVVSGALPSLNMQATYLLTLPVTGSAAPAVSVVKGRLPEGLTLNVSGTNATISGRPTEAGYFDLWLRLVDGANPKRTGVFYQRLDVKFNEPLQILTTNPPSIALGQAYAYQLQATGGIPFATGTAYKWKVVGTTGLPTPYVLAESGLISGTSDGTTPSNWAGNVTVEVEDASGGTRRVTLPMSITQLPPLVITTDTLPSGVALSAYPANVYLAAQGGLPPHTEWVVSPDTNTPAALPTGLRLNASTGLLDGTPQTAFNGQIRFSVKDSANPKNQTFKNILLTVVPIDALHVESVTPVKDGQVNALPDAFVGVAYGPIEVYIRGGIKPYSNPRLLAVYNPNGTETPIPTTLNLEIVAKPGADDRYLIRSKTGTTPAAAYNGPIWIVVDDTHSSEPIATRPYPPANASYNLYVDRFAPQGTISASPATVKQGETLTISGNYAIGGGTDTVAAKLKVVRKDNGAVVYPEVDLTPPSTSTTPTNFSRTDLNTATVPAGTTLVATLTLTNGSGKVVTKTAESTVSALNVSLSASPTAIDNDGVTFKSVSLTGDWSSGPFTAKLHDINDPNNPIQVSGSVTRLVAISHTPQKTTDYRLSVYDSNNIVVGTATVRVVVNFAPQTASISPSSQSVTAGTNFTVAPTFSGGTATLVATYGATQLYRTAVSSGQSVSIPTTGVPQNGQINITLTVTNNATPASVRTAIAAATVSVAAATLTAGSSTITRGQSVTLTWNWSGGASAKLFYRATSSGTWTEWTPAPAATGNRAHSPQSDTIYKLEVYDAGASMMTSSSATVTVVAPPDPDPIISTTSVGGFTYGSYGQITLAGTSGVPPYNWRLVSPSVASLKSQTNLDWDATTGKMYGTPSGSLSRLTFTVELQDNSNTNTDPQKTFTTTFSCPLIVNWQAVNLQSGQSLNMNTWVGGGAATSWSLSSTPSGVSLNASTGVLTMDSSSVDSTVTVTASNGSCSVSGSVRIRSVATPVAIDWVSNAITVGSSSAISLMQATASGGDGALTWGVADNAGAPSWPTWITPNPALTSVTGSGQKSFSIDPTGVTPGTYKARLKATDPSGTVGYSQDLTITVTAPAFNVTGYSNLGDSQGMFLGSVPADFANGGVTPASYFVRGGAFQITIIGIPADATLQASPQPGSPYGNFTFSKVSYNTTTKTGVFDVLLGSSSIPIPGGDSAAYVNLNVLVQGSGGISKTLTFQFHVYASGTPTVMKCMNSSGSVITLPQV